MEASDEEANERCMEVFREKERGVKRCIYQSKKKVNEQFARNMNEDMNRNRKLFWKRKVGELQHNKELKWEVGTIRG